MDTDLKLFRDIGSWRGFLSIGLTTADLKLTKTIRVMSDKLTIFSIVGQVMAIDAQTVLPERGPGCR